jgi:hypothetical protein
MVKQTNKNTVFPLALPWSWFMTALMWLTGKRILMKSKQINYPAEKRRQAEVWV